MSAKLKFKPFDERGDGRVYYNGFLPHWRQDHCTYFVTFRLADSIPQAVLDEWKYDRKKWLGARGIDPEQDDWLDHFRRLPKADRKAFERHFTAKLFTTLDQAHGSCILRRPDLAKIVVDSTMFFHGQRLACGDVVIMPNHVHALITPLPGFELEDLLHSIKSYSANEINRAARIEGKLWMRETHDHIVRDGEELLRIQNYIRKNPEKAKLPAGQFQLHTAEYDLTNC